MCVSGTARLSIVIPAKAGIQWPTTHPAEGVLGPGFRRGDELGRFANSINSPVHTLALVACGWTKSARMHGCLR